MYEFCKLLSHIHEPLPFIRVNVEALHLGLAKTGLNSEVVLIFSGLNSKILLYTGGIILKHSIIREAVCRYVY